MLEIGVKMQSEILELQKRAKTRNRGLMVAICLLAITLGAFSETVELKLTDGTIWHGEIGGHISLRKDEGRKTKFIEGTLIRDAGNFIVVSTSTGKSVVYISDIRSIESGSEPQIAEEETPKAPEESKTSSVSDAVDPPLTSIQCRNCNHKFSGLSELIDHLEAKQETLIRNQEEVASLLSEARKALSGKEDKVASSKRALTENPILKRFHGGELRIAPSQYFIYKLKGDKYPYGSQTQIFNFIIVFFVSKGGQGSIAGGTAGYFKIGGRTELLTIETTTPDVVTITRRADGRYDYAFAGSGVAEFHVKLAGSTTVVRIPVVELAVSRGTKSAEVISALGLPDREKKAYASWPDTKTNDGIIYSPNASQQVVMADHWYYDKIPHAVIAIEDGYVTDAGYYDHCDYCDIVHESLMDLSNWLSSRRSP